jgi:2-polyprenyl-3-methyl-5-hydroxy-6-metoxy-1,4-benzoquinol methylase
MINKLQKHELGFYEIKDKPTVKELQDYYANKYYQEVSSSGYEFNYSKDELEYFRVKNERYYSIAKKIRKIENGSFLDVGCGEGYGLSYFKEQGYIVKGLDFSSSGVSSKNPNCLNELVVGNLFELLKIEIESENTYDIIYLQNVLEHVIDPVDLLRNLHNILSLDGVIILTVPNDFSIIQKEAIRRKHIDREFWIATPDHLSYFEKDSLVNICKATGFNVCDLLGDFPIDLYLYHQGSNYIKDKSAGKSAHNARIELECLLAKQNMDDVLNLWRSMGQVGMGRDLTIFLTK